MLFNNCQKKLLKIVGTVLPGLPDIEEPFRIHRNKTIFQINQKIRKPYIG